MATPRGFKAKINALKLPELSPRAGDAGESGSSPRDKAKSSWDPVATAVVKQVRKAHVSLRAQKEAHFKAVSCSVWHSVNWNRSEYLDIFSIYRKLVSFTAQALCIKKSLLVF